MFNLGKISQPEKSEVFSFIRNVLEKYRWLKMLQQCSPHIFKRFYKTIKLEGETKELWL